MYGSGCLPGFAFDVSTVLASMVRRSSRDFFTSCPRWTICCFSSLATGWNRMGLSFLLDSWSSDVATTRLVSLDLVLVLMLPWAAHVRGGRASL